MNETVLKNRLKLARIEAGLTQAGLAERAGVTRQTVGLIEAGGYNPSLRLCIELARVTGKTLDELFWIPGD
ncbi:MAG: helix-turn-helix transcriptional regulator [Xanthomonadales bacterium]